MCVFGALSGSHTHSEPRIVIIFSELLQTDGQTDRMDGQTDVHRQTGRERDQIGNKEEDWKQGQKSNQQASDAGHKSSLLDQKKQF